MKAQKKSFVPNHQKKFFLLIFRSSQRNFGVGPAIRMVKRSYLVPGFILF
jgi:hypothetical protein